MRVICGELSADLAIERARRIDDRDVCVSFAP
jgi:hypothetical protein